MFRYPKFKFIKVLYNDFRAHKSHNHFYPTALKGCQGIVFTHVVRMGGRVSGLYLRNRKVLEVDTW